MKYFTQDYLDFFKELAHNNNKDWFDRNRKRYEASVREPFKVFTGDLIKGVSVMSPEVQIDIKDAVFRINRDIRFSKDKTPYKLRNSAIISGRGRKDKSYPGFYVELGPEHLGIFGGVYRADTRQIHKIRMHISKNLKTFERIISDKEFKEQFGILKGEKNKRIPKEFRAVAEKQPLIMNKQWYHSAFLDPEIIISDSLLETVLGYNTTSLKFKEFLLEALSV